MAENTEIRHVWEKIELAFHAARRYDSPYTDVEVYVDLAGPGFARRVYGFWDGGATFRVRILATAPGEWTWTSGSTPADPGLTGLAGSFRAIEWTEEEKRENICRRGLLRPTANGHAIEFADGTPHFLLGDTWWSVPTWRYRWYDDETERPVGPDMGFKDMVRYRRAQGFDCIAIMAGFPNWANDGLPPEIWIDVDGEKVWLRDAWPLPGTTSAKDMHNEGGRPFLFPGRVPGFAEIYPDMDRINPMYFRAMDRKIDYLNAHGFIPFIEAARRDVTMAWKQFHKWPDSYLRYVQYVWARYQANNTILSPIHFDCGYGSVFSRGFNEIAAALMAKGFPPFGTLVSCNSHGSTLVNFGNSDEAPWVTLHQIGNMRHHDSHWLLTEIWHESRPAKPALNGEPYYVGYPPKTPLVPESVESDRANRSGMYGSFLSGGFAGHVYGSVGLWGGDVEPAADYPQWEALAWKSGDEMRHLRTFALAAGERLADLVPIADLVSPNKSHETTGNSGWAYCARTPEKDLFMLYFEAGCPRAALRGVRYERDYRARWFDPRSGAWIDLGTIRSTPLCAIDVPPFPSEDDWALALELVT